MYRVPASSAPAQAKVRFCKIERDREELAAAAVEPAERGDDILFGLESRPREPESPRIGLEEGKQ